jgi:plasmid maintenance system antidote protein VapI
VNKPIGSIRACRVANSQQWGEFVRAHVAEFIASLEDAGLSHWDIAEALGCHRSTVSDWKNGRGDITAKGYFALKALADERGAKRKAVSA